MTDQPSRPRCYGGEDHPIEQIQNRYCNLCGEHWDEPYEDAALERRVAALERSFDIVGLVVVE